MEKGRTVAGSRRELPVAGTTDYAAPSVTVHGTLTELTRAALIGPFIDSNHSQGELIINNTSL